LLEVDGQQTATTAVGLELGSDDGLDGTIGFDGRDRAAWATATIAFLLAPACSALSQWRPNVISRRRSANR
jgi:hypothetical protein